MKFKHPSLFYIFLKRMIFKINNTIILLNKENHVIGENTNFKNVHLSGKLNIGNNVVIKNSTIQGEIKINDNVKIIENVKLSGNIFIGEQTSINGPGTDIIGKLNPIKIGKYCSIARNVAIQEYNHNYKRISSYFIGHHLLNDNFSNDITSNGEITIGNDVWIGTQSIILSGSKIGNGVVIAANTVVNGEIPDFSIVAGSPCKIIKYRFSNEIILKLNELQWWNWDKKKIKENKFLFEKDLTIDMLNKLY
jgi:virginiamycin A acetyltransferase